MAGRRALRWGGLAAAVSVGMCGLSSGPARASSLAVAVGPQTIGRIAPGFLGLSLEIRGVENYTGFSPGAINPVFEQLIRDLAPGRQQPVLRIAGGSTDRSWYPLARTRRPPGVNYALSQSWFRVIRALAGGIDARLIVGVNLELGSARAAGAEARAIVAGIGSPWLAALELGNEPELYNVLAWFERHHHDYYGRGPSWNFGAYLRNYARMRSALPNYPLAGPDVGSRGWLAGVGRFLSGEPQVRIATVHRYPLGCDRHNPATIAQLLSDGATRGFTNGLDGAVQAAHARGIPIRVDELNSVSCGGHHGVSDTFAAALWSLDAQFEVAAAGIDGVNIHTSDSTFNKLFSFRRLAGRWEGHVAPELYGLLTFAQAAPPRSRLLRVTEANSGPVHVWATRDPGGIQRVVLINLALRGGRSVTVRVSPASSRAKLERLQAPRVDATGQIALAGQSFGDWTRTGLLRGALHEPSLRSRGGGFSVWMPAASAAILTLRR